jgi:predicted membrane-bound mannosyltransferase
LPNSRLNCFNNRLTNRFFMPKSIINFLLLLGIIGIAIFFRFYQLELVPPGLYPDVAINGTDAIESLKTGQFKLFYPGNNGREGLFIWFDALSIYLFGAGIYALKFPAALAGTLTVIGLYLLGKELFGKKGENAALLASFFLAVSFWPVNFSRIGFRAILVPLCLVFAFYFFTKGFRYFFWRRFLHLHQFPARRSPAFFGFGWLVSLLLAGQTADQFFTRFRDLTGHYLHCRPAYRVIFFKQSG